MLLSKVKIVMTAAAIVPALASGAVALAQSGNGRPKDGTGNRKVVVTRPKVTDVVITQRYVCHIHARRHINVRALEKGYLNEIRIREGEAVKKGDLMFKIVPTRNKAILDAESVNVIAPFDGIAGLPHQQVGSLLKEGDILTSLSDNSEVWVYFDVPEKQYLEYMANRNQHAEDKIELVLANQTKFEQPGKLGAIEAKFNNKTGTIPFRADFPNPDGLLRHGQTGTILIHRKVHNAIVIPQRATYEILDKRYVYVVDKGDLPHRREIFVENEMDDTFVIKKGVSMGDRIVLEGIRQVRDGEKVEYEFRSPEEVLRKLKNHSE
jgi:membrane fusion protein (multidrug efflux system)